MSQSVKLDLETAQRMARATLRVEAMEPDGRGVPGVGRPRFRAQSPMWVEVTGADPDAADRYAWKEVIPDSSGDLLEPDPAVTGAGLFEANGGTLAVEQRVRARYVGQDANGMVWVCQAGGAGESVVAQITTPVSGQAGKYNAKRLIAPVPGSGNLSLSHWGTLSASDDCIVWDRNQTAVTPARPLTGLVVCGAVVARVGEVPIIEFASGIQKLRVASGVLQVAFISNPTESDWVNAILGTTCY